VSGCRTKLGKRKSNEPRRSPFLLRFRSASTFSDRASDLYYYSFAHLIGVDMFMHTTVSKGITPLPSYKSHKVVQALKIVDVVDHAHPDPDYNHEKFIASDEFKGSSLLFEDFIPVEVDPDWRRKHQPKAGGYFVVYEDGYRSFSPAEAFESGYTLVDDREPEDRLWKWFSYSHLPENLQKTSKPFHELAKHIALILEPGPERTVAMRKLLEAKDAAVRATLSPGG